ncbi:GNAT family N-acetyltransferase [Actinoplanes sp. NPDC051343]|uniref:GNAT family N-acetyltransferase n=1 Tax=Actinoplanes sp. NPDC051343 TaxID=3363906 RepID=UPI0037AF1D07
MADERTTTRAVLDGLTILLRPIRADDATAMLQFHARMSERTRYLRFFSNYAQVPPSHLQRFVNVDHHDREALVAWAGGAIVGVGRYDRLSPDAPNAEVSLVVEDGYQRRGIGSTLLRQLAQAARSNDITEFVATILPENIAILHLVRSFDHHVERKFAGGLVQLSFALAPAEAERRRVAALT